MGAIGTQMVDTTARVAALRELMAKQENNVDAFVVPSEDQRELFGYHQYEMCNMTLRLPCSASILPRSGRFQRVPGRV